MFSKSSLIGIGAATFVMLIGATMLFAQGSPDPDTLVALNPEPAAIKHLDIHGLGSAFTPLVTYHAPSVTKQAGKDGRTIQDETQSIALCMTLSGKPPIAVFSYQSGFPSEFEGDTIGGRRISAIGDGWVRFTDSTVIVQSPCAPVPSSNQEQLMSSQGSATAPSATPTPAPLFTPGGWYQPGQSLPSPQDSPTPSQENTP